METFTLAVSYLKDVLNGIEKTKSQDNSSTRNLFMALSKVHSTSKIAEQSELCANSNLNIFEEILCSKFTVLNKSMQVLISTIYEVLLSNTPGYVARNIVNALLGVCNNKSSSQGGKECAVMVIGKVMERRSSDLGSAINDVISCMQRLIRNMELPIRIVAVQALINLLVGAGSQMNDCHSELTKLGSKLASDKAIDMRLKAAVLLAEVGKSSGGFTSVSCDLLLGPVTKGLEDEVAVVQDTFAQAAAVLYIEQINAHVAGQEQAKIDLARGGSAPEGSANTSPPKQRRQSSIIRLKEMAVMSQPQKAAEVLDFEAVVGGIMKNIARAAAPLRAGFVCTLQHLCEEVVSTLGDESLGWLVTSIISMLRDPLIMALPYEEVVHFRSRLAHLIRRGVTSKITESNQLKLAYHFLNFFSAGKDSEGAGPVRNEHELQLGLGELGVVVTALGEAASAVCDDVKALATGQLRNSNFGVRAAAAHLLSSVAIVIPAIGATFLTEALNGANVQVKQLLAFTAADFSPEGEGNDGDEGNSSEGGGGKKAMNPKEAERLQRMFCFHGYTLVISVFLKNEKNIPTGLPVQLIMQAFDFGLEMLTLDIQAAPLHMRHVICSIIRAGSLVVSSCLSMGYSIAKFRIPRLLVCCNTLLAPCAQPAAPVPSPTAGQELLYELMSVEAALVCISTLLWFCPESLMNDENCLVNIVDGLENAFRAIKTKYQSKFKTHFRFRTLHVILLECFSWLPPGSFPNTCSQLFVEALRVFRDSITTGFECTCLNEFVPPDHSILNTFGVSRSSAYSFNDPPASENMMILRLENYSVALQKKESEAFLMCFSTDAEKGSEFRRTPLHAADWMEPSPPCAFIDSRTIDASISLIAATFGHQSNDYQEKAIQLCSQAIAQYIKGASSALGLFTTTEDRLRKDKKNYISLKNVTAVLSAIIRSFPFHNGMSLEMDLQWVQTVADIMFDMLSYPYAEIRSASSTALGTFCSKIFGAQLMDSMGMKITNALRTSVDKKGDTLGELSGHLLAISSLSLNATNLPGVQSNIAAIIFDTLKRTDSSLHFRAHGVFALSSMLKSGALVNQDSGDMGATMQYIDKVMQVLEIHLLHGSTPSDSAAIYEYDLLLVCLQRLVNVTASVLLEVDPTSENLHGLVKVWTVIQRASTNPSVQRECSEFILTGSVVLLSCKALEPVEMTHFVQHALADPRYLKTEHLQTLVQSVRILASVDSDVVCNSGLDIALFQLLDWCVSSVTGRRSSPYWGVELRSGVQNVIQKHSLLQREIESTLEFLVDVNVQVSPEKRATHWVLLSRVIALGLKTVSGGHVEHDDDEEKHDSDGHEGGGDSSKDKGMHAAANTMEIVHFANWCRDQAVEKAMSLTSTRSRLKYMAMRCATAAAIAGGQHGVALHSDLLLGRKKTRHALAALGTATPTDNQLWELECYMSLFLHDFISVGCACAAFSIEDHRLLSLQTVSLQFLEAVVNIFWNAIDPDHIHTSDGQASAACDNTPLSTAPSEKLLLQFMAQILSAVRSCLSAKFSPHLLWTSGSLVHDFIRGGLVSDKVIVRRIGKILQNSVDEEGTQEKDSPLSIPLRTAVSMKVAGKISTIQNVVSLTNFARLFLLTTNFGSELGDVGDEVSGCLTTLTTTHVSAVTEKWVAIATDAARILQTRGTPWPAETPETNARRGGITYDPMVEPSALQSHYELSLPYVVAAACASPSVSEDKFPVLFSVAQLYLSHLHINHKRRGNTMLSGDGDATLIRNIKPGLELLVIHSFASLAAKPAILSTIPCQEWTGLLSSLGSHIADLFVKMDANSSYEMLSNYMSLVVAIGGTLLPQVIALAPSSPDQVTTSSKKDHPSDEEKNDEENKEESTHQDLKSDFMTVLWNSLIAVLQSVCGGIFDNSSNDGSPKNTMYPKLCVQNKSTVGNAHHEGEFQWWVSAPKNIRITLQLLHTLNECSKGAKDVALDTYLGQVLISLIPYITQRTSDESAKNSLINKITVILREMMIDGRASESIVDSVVEELWMHHALSDTSPSTAKVVETTGRALFSTWVMLASALIKQQKQVTCTPPHLSAAILSTATSPSFLLSLISTSIQFLQQQAGQKVPPDVSFTAHFVEVRLIIAAVVPFLLHRLSSRKSLLAYAEVDKQGLQLIFAIFNVIPEDTPRQAYLSALFEPLCQLYTRRGEADTITLMCGKGVTHIARTHPNLFRQEIGSLLPEQTAILQNLMRVALQNMQASQASGTVSSPAAQSGGGTPGSIKKLDMKKWNKK